MVDKTCFFIAPIGEFDSDTRKRSDLILNYVIAPAVTKCGYKAIRADQISEPGMITSQVIEHIADDPLVIADLTERNPNVFYELAIRHAIRKPFIQLIKKGENIPFDVAATRTIHVDHRDLESVEQSKKEIIAQIEFIESNSTPLQTPFSVSLDLQSLRQSSNPEQRTLADVLSSIGELKSSIHELKFTQIKFETLKEDSYFHRVKARDRNKALLIRERLSDIKELVGEIDEWVPSKSGNPKSLGYDAIYGYIASIKVHLDEVLQLIYAHDE